MISPPVSDPRKEVRFGLVLYGGVSLAIYMYGIVEEFWRLVRASQGKEHNAYTSILRQAQVTATVDIISGTSAGGINGILLAKALATGSDLGLLKPFWVERADLAQLLRSPNEPDPSSLLRSDFFEDQLASVLSAMDNTASPALAPVLDLFVSGTRLRGALRTFTGALGEDIETLVFRKEFHLKLRRSGYLSGAAPGYDWNDFTPDANAMLVEIARATSAFPAALEPKLIDKRTDNAVLYERGEPNDAYFSDGGILHNRPFTETIDTIFARSAEHPVRRWLVSVDPAPEMYRPAPSPETPPTVLEVVLKALAGIPGYQSIAADMDAINAHSARVGAATSALGKAEESITTQFSNAITADLRGFLSGQILYAPYRDLKTSRVITDLTSAIVTAARLSTDEAPLAEGGVRARAREDEVGFLDSFDIGFRVRRLYYLIGVLDEFLASLPLSERAPFRSAYRELWTQFDRTRAAWWEVFAGSAQVTTSVREIGKAGADALSQAVQALLPAVSAYLNQTLARIRDDAAATCRSVDRAMLALRARNVRAAYPPEPFLLIFEHYEVRDMFIFPLEALGDVGERDPINVARISPRDARYIRKLEGTTVLGTRLGHFGGFVSRDWRQNDIMWGRLDAAEVIVLMLLELPRQQAEPAIRAVQEEIFRQELPAVAPTVSDYRAYLENQYTLGNQQLSDLPGPYRVNIAMQAARIFRNMLRPLEQSSSSAGVLFRAQQALFHYLGAILGAVLNLLQWPVLAIWGRDWVVRRFVTLFLLFLFGWSALALVAAVVWRVPLGAAAILWIALLGVPYLIYVLLLNRAWGALLIVLVILAIFAAVVPYLAKALAVLRAAHLLP